MPKLKTHKATAKKVKITKGKAGKLITKHAGQDHFNARESGRVGRHKKGDTEVAMTHKKTIMRQIPYN